MKRERILFYMGVTVGALGAVVEPERVPDEEVLREIVGQLAAALEGELTRDEVKTMLDRRELQTFVEAFRGAP